MVALLAPLTCWSCSSATEFSMAYPDLGGHLLCKYSGQEVRMSAPRSTTPATPSRLLRASLRTTLIGLLWLSPLAAGAEERDASEIGHHVIVMGLITLLFLTCWAMAIWLLILRLRSRYSSKPVPLPVTLTQPRPNLERLWFPRN
jgi:hypothetical protein